MNVASPPSASILVVDDEAGIAALCERVLSRAGYQVTALTDPRAAIERIQQTRINLLLVDIRMPEVDGFDVIARAKILQPDIAVLVMTGFGTVETAVRALRQGVDGLLLKPFETGDELTQAAQQALSDNYRKRDAARVQALRPLFDVTETLFAETNQEKLLSLILSAVQDHLRCSNAAYYRIERDAITALTQIGKALPIQTDPAVDELIRRVVEDKDPMIIHATGPGEAQAQALLSKSGLGSAIFIPVSRANIDSVLFAARSSSEAQFRGADLELFFVLARQAVIAMENARLYADLRETLQQVEESQQALLRAEKMVAAGRLTASIAHEVNNPLQSVQNCLHLAGREDLSIEKRKEYFDLARAELDRLMKTMHRMLEFYRPGAARMEFVDALELLQHVLNLTSQQLHQRDIHVKTNFPTSLPLIYAVNGQIQQVFINLILNAHDALLTGGELEISARNVDNGIEFIFSDNGPGIPEDRRNNIFEPFFSTKEGGTGLGLTVSYNIITAHGGALDLVDHRKPGAHFRLFLPLKKNADSAHRA